MSLNILVSLKKLKFNKKNIKIIESSKKWFFDCVKNCMLNVWLVTIEESEKNIAYESKIYCLCYRRLQATT